MDWSASSHALARSWTGERRDELFVEIEQELEALALGGKGLATIASVHGTVERSMRVLDAREGVKAQSETVWR